MITNEKATMMIKVSHISLINMLEEKIGKCISSFKELEKYTLENLEELRDDLVVEYNKVIEARRFAAEIIYNKNKKPDFGKELTNLAKEEMYFVNKDNWQEKFWNNNYHIWLTAQGIQFCVNADCTKDALDFIMDYCVEKEMKGLYITPEDENWNDKEEEFITAGNFGYKFTTHNIRIKTID